MKALYNTLLILLLTVVSARTGPLPTDPTTIGEAKLRPDGAYVKLVGKIATSCADDFTPILPQFSSGVQVGAVQSAAINEASGLAASRKNSDVLWVHNDSGDSARVFAMNTTGTHLGIYNLAGSAAVDWEDMCVGPGPTSGQDYLYLGDIGDNGATRTNIVVYRVPEPTVSSTQPPANVNLTGVEKLTLQYEDGARDAETLMVDPATGDLYVVSKREAQSRVYRAPAAELTTSGTITLHFMTQLPWGWSTAGDITPQGDEIIIRGYGSASVWSRPRGTDLWAALGGTEHTVPLMTELQGEAVAYDADGMGYYTVSEGVNQPIYYFARTPAPGPDFFYIQEPGRSSGIRVAQSPAATPGLVRGSMVNAEGLLGTTSDGERQLVDATVTLAPDPPSPATPLAMNNQSLGGGDSGAPPAGQHGVTGGVGLNNVGLLVKTSGRITSITVPENYAEITDGAEATVRVDTTYLRTPLNQGQSVGVTGILSLHRPAADRLRLLIPRSDSDLQP